MSKVGAVTIPVAAVAILPAPAASAATSAEAKLQRQLNALVAAGGGPQARS
jgi:hypothetical protein